VLLAPTAIRRGPEPAGIAIGVLYAPSGVSRATSVVAKRGVQYAPSVPSTMPKPASPPALVISGA
jgi:hypothetical protein